MASQIRFRAGLEQPSRFFFNNEAINSPSLSEVLKNQYDILPKRGLVTYSKPYPIQRSSVRMVYITGAWIHYDLEAVGGAIPRSVLLRSEEATFSDLFSLRQRHGESERSMKALEISSDQKEGKKYVQVKMEAQFCSESTSSVSRTSHQ
ncbi:hypothetical protein U9M48_039300 [Paspalum notatum var. saurae]|uniref:Uncharacterized protein n=1 Tax=Paspalum notatum var. saurae TaxID=547442 RepID=A0AAQ3XD25_PASNO